MLDKLEYKIRVARLQELDSNWRTAKFAPISRVIPYSRLYFPLEGRGTATLDGLTHSIEPGKMLLIPPYAKVELECPRRLLKYWTHFNARLPGSELDAFSLCAGCLEVEVEDMQWHRQLFSRLVGLHHHPNVELPPLERLEAVSALSLLLLGFLRIVAMRRDSRLPAGGPCFSRLLAHLEKNLYQPLTLREIARAVNLHPTYASNLFKEKMGVSLIHYRNQRRVRAAVSYFHNTDHSVSEVADLVGMGDISNFTKMFKRYTGHLPLRYKKDIARSGHEPLQP